MSCQKQNHYRTKSADYISYYVQKRVNKFLLKYCTKTETKVTRFWLIYSNDLGELLNSLYVRILPTKDT